MADVAISGAQLKKMLAMAKKKEMAFAYCPGGKPADDVFVLDRKKKPDVIGRAARAEGEGSKLAFGMGSLKGKVLSLKCERELPGMAKKLKRWLRDEKCPLNVKILDMNGNVLEEDIEDLPDDDFLGDVEIDDEDGDAEDTSNDASEDAQEDGNDANDDGERLKALKARAAAMQGGIQALAPEAQGQLVPGFKKGVAAIQGSDLDTAETIMDRLEQALAKLSAASGVAPPPPTDGDPMQVKLGMAATQLLKRIDGLPEGAGKDRLLTVHAALLGQIDSGDIKKAGATAKALGEAISKVSASDKAAASTETANAPEENVEADTQQAEAQEPIDPNASEDGKAWNAERARLEPVILNLLEKGFGDVSKMRAAWAFFTEKGSLGAFADGMKIAPGLDKLIAAAEAAEQSDAEKDIPADVVPFVQARLSWAKARNQLQSEMMKLENAILAVCQGEEFKGMANDTKALFTYLENLDDRLEGALEALVTAPDGDKRESLKTDARKVLGEYMSELDSPFFKDVDSNNGFASVNVRSTAANALAAVDSVLSKAA